MDQGGRVVEWRDFARRSWMHRLFDWGAYALMRAAIFLTSRRY
jgi:hypothetical protein